MVIVFLGRYWRRGGNTSRREDKPVAGLVCFSLFLGFGAQIGFLMMQSQVQACSQQFYRFLWEKPIKILLKIGSEWEENYSCTNAITYARVHKR